MYNIKGEKVICGWKIKIKQKKNDRKHAFYKMKYNKLNGTDKNKYDSKSKRRRFNSKRDLRP